MTDSISELSSLDDLRSFVKQTICDRNQLLQGAFELRQKTLVKQGKPCGLHFIIYGPRAVQFSAIWDAERQVILFYGSNGARFDSRRLQAGERLSAALRADRDE